MLDEVLEVSFGQVFNVHNKMRGLHVHNLLTHILSLFYQSVLVVPMYIMRVGVGQDIVMRAKCWISKSSVKVSLESRIEGQSPSLPLIGPSPP